MQNFDIHFHVLGDDQDWDETLAGDALYYNPYDNDHWITNLTRHDVELQLGAYEHLLGLRGKLTTATYLEIARRTLMRANEIDRVVLLALDAVFAPDGEPDRKVTDIWVPNRYLAARIVEANQKLAAEGHEAKKIPAGCVGEPIPLGLERKARGSV